MAIVQISRIQHRKGLQQDLPQLASAELGWSIDTRQLYIGNGTISEGAPAEGVTEILTQYTDLLNVGSQYTFRGAESGYTSQTGASALSPVQRTLQNKLDDFINVRDFGAIGNGTTDDTTAIQRAIDEILFGGFAVTQAKLRRAIYFPAGTFLISSSLKAPSYLTMYGAGIEKTTIQHSGAGVPLMQLKDSSSQIDGAYATNGAATAKYILLQDMTFENVGDSHVVKLDSCDNITFNRIAFKGAQSSPQTSSVNTQNAVHGIPLDPSKDINNVTFIDCSFNKCVNGLVLNANNVKLIGCDFVQLNRGIWAGEFAGATTKNIKVSNSTFNSIAREGIYANVGVSTGMGGIFSVGNYYGDIGANLVVGGSVIAPVIYFSNSGNYSISDSFKRSDAEHGTYPRVQHVDGTLSTSIDSNVGIQTGMITRGSGRVLTIAASQTNANTGIILTGAANGAASIHYSLERPGASAYRHGTIDVVFTGTDVKYTDEYVEHPNATNFVYPGPTGVTFTVTSVSSGVMKVSYTSDSAGTGTLTYSVTKFQV